MILVIRSRESRTDPPSDVDSLSTSFIDSARKFTCRTHPPGEPGSKIAGPVWNWLIRIVSRYYVAAKGTFEKARPFAPTRKDFSDLFF